MDFTKRNRIREKEYYKIAEDISRKLYRTDIDDIFKEMIDEKDLNNSECSIIRKYFENIVISGEQTDIKKTSYYHISIELHNKAMTKDNNIHTWNEITKKNKLNSNEVEILKVVLATQISWILLKATLR